MCIRDRDKAVDSILNDCTPALNKAVKIATRLDEMTDEVSSQAVRITVISAVDVYKRQPLEE